MDEVVRTKLEQSERALSRANEYLRVVIESVEDHVILTMDKDRRVLTWNKGAEAITGYSEDEIIGQSADIIFTEEDRKNNQPEIEAQKAIEEGRAENRRWHVRKNGSLYWGSGSVSPMRHSDGRLLGFVKIMRDLTESKHAEDELKRSAERLQLALDAGKLGLYEYDFQTRQTTATALHKANCGLTENEQFIFDELKNLVLPEDREATETELNRAIAEGSVYTAEYRIRLKTGAIRWIKSVGRVVCNEANQPKKLVGTTMDITEQKHFTEELNKLINERTMQLQRSNEDLRQFAHVASHDLKEPVRKIKTFNNRVIDEFSHVLPPVAKTYLSKIDNATSRMNSMIDGVLNYSKFEYSEIDFTTVNLSEVLEDIETDLELLIESKKASIKRGQMPVVRGNKLWLYQLFYNLVLNSLKFSKKDVASVIDIGWEEVKEDEKKIVKIILSDNGIGFDKEFKEVIFDTFTRLNPADKYEGTGLGLALCKKIVERHRGSIVAEGEPEAGATFTIKLPVV